MWRRSRGNYGARNRDRLLKVFPLVLLLGVWPFGGGSKIIMSTSQASPAAKGVIKLSHDSNNNTKVDIDVRYLAEPGALTPAESTYVVWIQANGQQPQNKGELKLGKDRNANLDFVTPYKQFNVFVTAEQSAQTSAPSGEKVLSAEVSKD